MGIHNNWFAVYANPHLHSNGAISFGMHVYCTTAEQAAIVAESSTDSPVAVVLPCTNGMRCDHPTAVSGYGSYVVPKRDVNETVACHTPDPRLEVVLTNGVRR